MHCQPTEVDFTLRLARKDLKTSSVTPKCLLAKEDKLMPQ